MKRIAAILICIFTLLAVCACGKTPEAGEGDAPQTSAPAQESGAESTAEQDESSAQTDESSREQYIEEHESDYSWRYAFSVYDNIEKGWVTLDCVSFAYPDGEGGAEIVNVPFDEVRAFSAAGKGIPRTHYFDDKFSDVYKEYVLPAIDYALAHGCLDFAFATDHVARDDIECIKSGDGPTSRDYLDSIVHFDLDYAYIDYLDWYKKDGHDIIFWKISFFEPFYYGPELNKKLANHTRAVEAAAKRVESMNPRFSDYQKALYLYTYVTENVKFAGSDYYDDGTYNFLYDALVKKSAVCTGYSLALYYLFNMAGIDCVEVHLSYGDGSGHTLNAAKLGDKYYYFDATEDSGAEIEDYAFFGVSLDTLAFSENEEINEALREAIRNSGVIPVCDSELSDVWDRNDSGIAW